MLASGELKGIERVLTFWDTRGFRKDVKIFLSGGEKKIVH
jgi:hypothetical protein